MSYSMFKKLGREDDILVKTNVTLNDVGGNPMEARGVVSMALTMGSMLLTTTLAYIALADGTANWQHGSITKDGSILVSMQLASEAQLSNVVFP
jgi:hypothetical protein